jgi:predicted ATPase
MRLLSLTVVNFRSITKAHKLQFSDSTVLIGPNNEGKSNILRALVTALRVLERAHVFHQSGSKSKSAYVPRVYYRNDYKWESDYPISQQQRHPDGRSEFTVEFILDPQEIVEFKQKIGYKLSGKLALKVELGRDSGALSVSIQGPAAKALTAKLNRIGQFIAEKIRIRYVPAVRTERAAHAVVDSLLATELQAIESDPQYIAALNQIEKIQAPVLEQLSKRLKLTMKDFLPAVKDIRVRIAKEARREALRTSEIIVDDGNPTHLRHKGDGVQSLAALALMRNPPGLVEKGIHTIVAIEEPESHLHPSAIHSLRSVLDDIARKQQVVLTTHCPIFVDRTNIGSNILVKGGKAQSSANIQQIRDILGVRASDNLRHAKVVLLVEGEDDRLILKSILPHRSLQISKAIAQGAMVIDSLNGGANLSYKAGLVKEALCGCHAFLDNDESGREAAEKARIQGTLETADINFANCLGMQNSEIEDLIDTSVYEHMILQKYRVSLSDPTFKTNKKWSDRMKATFQHQGKSWNERLEAEVKLSVAEVVAQDIPAALNKHREAAVDALVNVLCDRLRE